MPEKQGDPSAISIRRQIHDFAPPLRGGLPFRHFCILIVFTLRQKSKQIELFSI
jgi:hypothetical protein